MRVNLLTLIALATCYAAEGGEVNCTELGFDPAVLKCDTCVRLRRSLEPQKEAEGIEKECRQCCNLVDASWNWLTSRMALEARQDLSDFVNRKVPELKKRGYDITVSIRHLVQTVLALTKVDDAGKEEEEAETDYLEVFDWKTDELVEYIALHLERKDASDEVARRRMRSSELAFHSIDSGGGTGVERMFGGNGAPALVLGICVKRACLHHQVQHMEAVPVRRDYPLPLNWCLPPPQLDMKFLTAVRVSVLQFVFLKPLCAVAALLCSLHGLYKEGDLGLWAPFTWIFLVVHTSLSIAMYGLATFYWILQDLLEPYRPLSKFALIKLIVFLPWFQYTLVVAVWFMFGRSFSDDTYTTALVYEGLLECVELDGEREVTEGLKSLLLPEDILREALDVVTGGGAGSASRSTSSSLGRGHRGESNSVAVRRSVQHEHDQRASNEVEL
ncbi:hypothetical protein FOZ60_013929 [Perkinsus olseni]|uniref:Transmembrane protein n=1 Tax=Perkinsus olseni TaxID=32597 RepID=A0A7J6P7W0_PEROL|nr:hypothetical protein FOZ60_013929 [Perkinsus olseni]